MKKFSSNKINESVETIKISTSDKLKSLIEETLLVEINSEPNVNENYNIEGKDELISILTEKYTEEVNKHINLLKEKISSKYHNYINKEEINSLIEKLKS